MTLLPLNGRSVDLQQGTVTDPFGYPVTLRPQAAEVLKVLAARRGALVTKDEFVTAVWGGIAVTDDSLVQCITDIRKALGDDKHTIVRTVLKRGYVLEAAARAGTKPTHWPLGRWAALAAGAAGLAALAGFYLLPLSKSAAEPPAIAVLPFDNLSASSTWDRLADGMTEDIITDLARFRDIPVIARTSTEAYRGKAHDVRAIGKELDVEYVLRAERAGRVGGDLIRDRMISGKSG